jgi:hypothetical protein
VEEEQEWYRKLEEATAMMQIAGQREKVLLAWEGEEAARSSS